MKNLIEKLNFYTKAYEEGNPKISDEDWDNLYFQLKNLEEETGIIYTSSPTQKIIYEVVNNLKKVKHNHKMLSLDKTKDEVEVENFLKNKDFVAMAKMDGLTCSLKYQDGKLVSAETRGNGEIGEDVTHNARVIPSIPKTIPITDEFIVDGEIICTYNDFEVFSNEYKNPRNFASGSIRLLDASECAKRTLTFVAWDLISGIDENSFHKRLEKLPDFGFTVVPWVIEDTTHAINDIKDYCKNHSYPIDGIVFKFDDVAYGKSLGETDHHTKNAIAYKFYDEEYETTLKGIEFTMGRTGILTPVAIYNEVEIDGSICNRANLHNLSVLTKVLEVPYIGQKIWITKRNMIIPQIERAEKKQAEYQKKDYTTFIPFPKECPICGKPVEIVKSDNDVYNLYCSNPECAGKLVNKLDHFCGKKGLDIKGLSIATLNKLIEWNWVNSVLDIYSLKDHEKEWVLKPGFGEKSVQNILDAIEESKNCSFEAFISSLGIPMIGKAMAKEIVKYFVSYEELRKAVNENYDFSELEGFGDGKSNSLLEFDYTEADQLYNILDVKLAETIADTSTKPLEGKKYVITGSLTQFKNRNELQSLIESLGGKVLSSVSKNADYLINNNPTSTSAKNVAAKKLGIPIITELEFMNTF